jgi:RNA polymerase sigma factor (TIGR02999 family)
MPELTQLLMRMRDGDVAARDALFSACYSELKRMARSRLRDSAHFTVLDATALVHESYLRMIQVGQLRAQDRNAFFAFAARVMRSVIIDEARARIADRRGGGSRPVTLSTGIIESVAQDDEGILKIHEALDMLAAVDLRLAQVVEMRYFGGYSNEEIAETLAMNERTVRRDWDKACCMLNAIVKG